MLEKTKNCPAGSSHPVTFLDEFFEIQPCILSTLLEDWEIWANWRDNYVLSFVFLFLLSWLTMLLYLNRQDWLMIRSCSKSDKA